MVASHAQRKSNLSVELTPPFHADQWPPSHHKKNADDTFQKMIHTALRSLDLHLESPHSTGSKGDSEEWPQYLHIILILYTKKLKIKLWRNHIVLHKKIWSFRTNDFLLFPLPAKISVRHIAATELPIRDMVTVLLLAVTTHIMQVTRIFYKLLTSMF